MSIQNRQFILEPCIATVCRWGSEGLYASCRLLTVTIRQRLTMVTSVPCWTHIVLRKRPIKNVLLWLITAGGCLAFSTHSRERAVLLEDFEQASNNGLYGLLLENQYLEVVESERVGNSRALRATYQGSARGSERITERLFLGERGPEYTLSYDVKFDEDFQFVKGGKLHGLGPDAPITGGRAMQPAGWSARVTFKEGGHVRSYLYCQNKDGRYGTGKYNQKFRFEKERYYSVSLHVRLNGAADARDGFADIYINGERVIQHDDVQFRAATEQKSLISTFLFSTFHGGNKPRWAPRDFRGNYQDVHAYFDNLAVYRGRRIRDGAK